MRLAPGELARLDAAMAAGQAPPVPPPLPGLDDAPTTVATLMRYRRARLAQGRAAT